MAVHSSECGEMKCTGKEGNEKIVWQRHSNPLIKNSMGKALTDQNRFVKAKKSADVRTKKNKDMKRQGKDRQGAD